MIQPIHFGSAPLLTTEIEVEEQQHPKAIGTKSLSQSACSDAPDRIDVVEAAGFRRGDVQENVGKAGPSRRVSAASWARSQAR